jgi:putative oxidoreductase
MQPILRWLVPRLPRWIIGTVLIYASYHKIVDPPDFAKVLYNYKIFPGTWLNPLAVVVPWIEAFAGIALICGVAVRGASLISVGLFTSFIVILAYNLDRGCPTICGCFSTFEAGKALTVDEKFSKMRWEIWMVDVPCLALSLGALVLSFRSRIAPSSKP